MSDDREMFPELPVIVPLDELMQSFSALPIDAVRKALAVQGLHVVGDKEMAVLVAASLLDYDDLADIENLESEACQAFCEAEIARKPRRGAS